MMFLFHNMCFSAWGTLPVQRLFYILKYDPSQSFSGGKKTLDGQGEEWLIIETWRKTGKHITAAGENKHEEDSFDSFRWDKDNEAGDRL